MATVQRLEDLEIWKKARELAKEIYALTFKEPISLDLRLKDQMRGSVGSIMDNIAEGFERASRLEFLNCLSTIQRRGRRIKISIIPGNGCQLY